MRWAVIASLVFVILKLFLGKMNEKQYIATILVHFISSFSVSRIQSPLRNYSNIFNIHGSLHLKNVLIYIQQDATLHSLFYLETALHVSGGTTTHHQERKQLYLQHLLFVRPLLLPAAIAAGSSNRLTNTRCCRYSCMRSWLWVEITPETCTAVSR